MNEGAPIMDVLDDVVDCTLFGSGGLFVVPRGGYLGVQWLNRKKCYRVTFDVVIASPEKRQEPEGIGARRVTRWEAAQSAPASTGRA